MRWLTSWYGIEAAFALCLAICAYLAGWQRRDRRAYDAGYDEGWEDGHREWLPLPHERLVPLEPLPHYENPVMTGPLPPSLGLAPVSIPPPCEVCGGTRWATVVKGRSWRCRTCGHMREAAAMIMEAIGAQADQPWPEEDIDGLPAPEGARLDQVPRWQASGQLAVPGMREAAPDEESGAAPGGGEADGALTYVPAWEPWSLSQNPTLEEEVAAMIANAEACPAVRWLAEVSA